MVGKYNINLLQAELLPEKVLLTFSRVIALWLVCLVIMIAWTLVTQLQHQSLNKKNNDLKFEKISQTNSMTSLEQQLTNRKVDVVLEEKLATLKFLLLHKDALHRKLTDKKQTFVSDFALAMTELSELHHNDIRLQSININNENMSFKGFAKTPETVPAWLAGFEYSTLLSGKSFVHFKLTKNEKNMTEFIVSSSAIEEDSE